MFCFKCGASIPDNSPACPKCGAAPGAPPPASTMAPGTAPARVPQAMPQRQPYMGQQQTEGKATASLILGILSLTCFSIFAGIPAVICGHKAQSNIRKSAGRLGGQGMATAGLVMGYISIAFFIPIMLIESAV